MRVSGLELHSNSTEPVHFFGAQAVIWWGTAPESPPPGHATQTFPCFNGFTLRVWRATLPTLISQELTGLTIGVFCLCITLYQLIFTPNVDQVLTLYKVAIRIENLSTSPKKTSSERDKLNFRELKEKFYFRPLPTSFRAYDGLGHFYLSLPILKCLSKKRFKLPSDFP